MARDEEARVFPNRRRRIEPSRRRPRDTEEADQGPPRQRPRLSRPANVFTVEVTNFPNTDRPQQFRFRFVETPQNSGWRSSRILTRLVSQMRRFIQQRIGPILYPVGRINNRNVDRNVTGMLTAQSLINANVVAQRRYQEDADRQRRRRRTTPEADERYQSARRFRLADINMVELLHMFERMQQSNTEVDLPMIEWTFHVDPRSYVLGGARSVTLKLKTAFQKTLTEWYDDEGITF